MMVCVGQSSTLFASLFLEDFLEGFGWMRSKKQRTDELGKEKQTIGKVEEVDL
jgi:hypothetical protein